MAILLIDPHQATPRCPNRAHARMFFDDGDYTDAEILERAIKNLKRGFGNGYCIHCLMEGKYRIVR